MEREREEREGGESTRKKKEGGRGRGVEQTSLCAALLWHRGFKLDCLGCSSDTGERGATRGSGHGSFRVGCLKTAHRHSNLQKRETGMRIPPKWKGSYLR